MHGSVVQKRVHGGRIRNVAGNVPSVVDCRSIRNCAKADTTKVMHIAVIQKRMLTAGCQVRIPDDNSKVIDSSSDAKISAESSQVMHRSVVQKRMPKTGIGRFARQIRATDNTP